MKLTIQNLHKRSHKTLTITGKHDDISKLNKLLQEKRLQYSMDYADSGDVSPNTGFIEYIAHRKDHKKAAAFIRSMMMEVA